MNDQVKEVLTIEEISKILRISPIKCYQMAKQNEFPVIKIGRVIRVPADAFYRWFNNYPSNQATKKEDVKQ